MYFKNGRHPSMSFTNYGYYSWLYILLFLFLGCFSSWFPYFPMLDASKGLHIFISSAGLRSDLRGRKDMKLPIFCNSSGKSLLLLVTCHWLLSSLRWGDTFNIQNNNFIFLSYLIFLPRLVYRKLVRWVRLKTLKNYVKVQFKVVIQLSCLKIKSLN